MQIKIEKKGLQTLLYTLLSCRCPVNEDTEKKLFREYFRVRDSETIDFNSILRIADKNPQKTPIHLLFDFCSYSKDDLSSFTITHNDVIRYLCTNYHFANMIGSLNPLVVKNTSSFIVSHMLLPASVNKNGDRIEAEYRINGKSIRFNNMIFMPGLEWNEDSCYGIHLGAVVTDLSRNQAKMIENHLGLIKDYALLTEDVSEVDFKEFQHYGDYSSQVMIRVKRNFPG